MNPPPTARPAAGFGPDSAVFARRLPEPVSLADAEGNAADPMTPAVFAVTATTVGVGEDREGGAA